MMRVIRMIQAKGYDFDTARDIAHRIFDEYYHQGHSILKRVDRVLTADEYNAIYKEA